MSIVPLSPAEMMNDFISFQNLGPIPMSFSPKGKLIKILWGYLCQIPQKYMNKFKYFNKIN
jgi:hypothetical protein